MFINYLCAHVYTYSCTHVHTRLYICMCTFTHTHVYTCSSIFAYIHVYTYLYTLVPTYTQMSQTNVSVSTQKVWPSLVASPIDLA